jgi:hypothetical protein
MPVFLLMATTYAQTEIKIWNGTADKTWYTDSTTASIYRISTAEQLAGLADLFPPNATATQNFDGKTIILMNDIMLNDITDWENWGTNPPANVWTPIATGVVAARWFQGTFDGNGHIISGIYISNTTDYQGLFGRTQSNKTVIKNLGITKSYIKGGNYSGGIVAENKGKLYNSFAISTKVVNHNFKDHYIGGLLGYNFSTLSEVNNCYFAGEVLDTGGDPHFYGGGIVGKNNSGKVSNNYYDETTNLTARTSGNDLPGTGNGRTTEEMQSQNFVDALNNVAGSAFTSAVNKWDFNGGYPVLLPDETAPNLFDKKFAEGEGTESSPFEINDEQQLKNLSVLASQVDLRGYYFKLGQDIKLPEGIWVPIGTETKPFNGNFNGNSKTISNIRTNENLSYQGLFGSVGSNGIVKNIGVIDSDIKGKDYAGGIAGYSAGTISNSHSTATVSGNKYIGGFVGHNAGTINSSYSTGNVSGTDYVGGFAGNNAKDIGIAYSAGKVTGKAYVGGFAGSNCESCNIVGGYYNKSINSDPRVEGIADTAMKSATFVKELNNIAVAFGANEWTAVTNGYPVLSNKIATSYDLANYFESGNGNKESPYLISTPKHLDYLSLLVGTGNENFKGQVFKLANDIELSPSKNFTPIGKISSTSNRIGAGNSFQGTFDGNGKTISGLYINSNAEYGIGLFSYVYNGGTIKNLKITDSNVKGKRYIGGLVGMLTDSDNATLGSLVENCSFSGTVTGTASTSDGGRGARAGGLVGYNYNAKIKNSYSTGEVNGNEDYVGGLVGDNVGAIDSSYSASVVKGNNVVGGLVGRNWNPLPTHLGTIDNSYSTGKVTGNNNVGGLAGYGSDIQATNMKKNYSTSAVTGNTNVGGLFGNNGDGKTEDSYATGSVNGQTNVGGLVGYLNSNSKLISNSYSVGKVTGNSDKGGLIGKKFALTGGANNSYYDKTINNAFEDDEGKTTSQLKNEETFENWDFEDTWAIDDEGIINKGYPYLKGIGEDMLICVADGKYKWGDGCELKTEQELCDEDANKVWEGGVCKTTPSSSSSTPSSTTPSSSSKPQTEQQICQASKGVWYKDYCYSTQADKNEAVCYEKEGQYWENNKCNKEPTPVQPATIASGKLIVRAIPNGINIENLPQNAKVDVYNLLGERIYSAYPGNPQILRILVQTKGIYLVKINNQTSLKVTIM